jgi:uncharacterized HAD superfamily protein
MRKVWAFDVDGVISDTYTYFKREVEKEYNLCFLDAMPYYPHKVFNNIDGKTVYTILDNIFKNGIAKPICYAIDVINAYHFFNKRIVFITHRKSELYGFTTLWLNKHFTFNYELYQGNFNKVDIAKEVDVIGIIDDKPSICRDFLNNNLQAICHEQPFQKFEDLTGLNVINWEQIAEIIL